MCWAQVRLIPDFLTQEQSLGATAAPSPTNIMLIYIIKDFLTSCGSHREGSDSGNWGWAQETKYGLVNVYSMPEP